LSLPLLPPAVSDKEMNVSLSTEAERERGENRVWRTEEEKKIKQAVFSQ